MSESDGECTERFHDARRLVLRESMGTALERYVLSELDDDKKYVSGRRNFLRTLTVNEIELMQKLSQLCGAVNSSNFFIARYSATLELSAETVTGLQSEILDAGYRCASLCVQLEAAKRKRLNLFSQVFEVSDFTTFEVSDFRKPLSI